jgi:DNA anti-recombination protein RmuC
MFEMVEKGLENFKTIFRNITESVESYSNIIDSYNNEIFSRLNEIENFRSKKEQDKIRMEETLTLDYLLE